MSWTKRGHLLEVSFTHTDIHTHTQAYTLLKWLFVVYTVVLYGLGRWTRSVFLLHLRAKFVACSLG